MKKLIFAAMLSISLTGCGNSNTAGTSSYLTTQSVDSGINASASKTSLRAQGDGMARMPMGKKGEGFMKGGMGFFGNVDLGLTDDQKAQLKALQPQPKAKTDNAQKPDMSAMKAKRQALIDAFEGDSLDKATLKSLMDALKPAAPSDSDKDARLTAQAERLVKTYAILTAEQRQKLADAKKAMADKMSQVKPAANTANADKFKDAQNKGFDAMATKLGLNDEQKAALQDLVKPSFDATAMQAERDKRKANQDALDSLLTSGTATVDAVKGLLSSNKPADMSANEDARLDKIVKLHDLLNSDQRKQLVSVVLGGGHGFGRMGHGGKGGFGGHGGFGGPEGKRGFMGHGAKPASAPSTSPAN